MTKAKKCPFDCIDVTVGTRRDNGDLFPIASFPRGMAAFTVQTAPDGQERFYEKDGDFRGIRLTHCVSYDSGDFGFLTLMPQTGEIIGDDSRRCAASLTFAPNGISGRLDRYKLSFELVPGVYGCFLRLRFDEGCEKRRLLIMGGGFGLKLAAGGRAIVGTTDAGGDCAEAPLTEYLNFMSDTDFEFVSTEFGGAMEFDADTVNITLATSFISHEQAILLWRREFDGRTLERARADCRNVWEHFLHRVDIRAVGKRQRARREMFYTCMYRVLLLPRRFFEISQACEPIHIDLKHGGAVSGVQYMGCDLWASARTVLPLTAVIAPDVYTEFADALLTTSIDIGKLPQGMIPYDGTYSSGVPAEIIFSDAVVKHVAGEKRALQMMHAVRESVVNTRRLSLYGRAGADFYMAEGYLPCDRVKESVSETLEYCLGDYCFTRAAEAIIMSSVYGFRGKGAENYKNLFDGREGRFFARRSDASIKEADDTDFFERARAGAEFGVLYDAAGTCSAMEDWRGRLGDILGLKRDSLGRLIGVRGEAVFSSPANLHLPYVFAEMGEPETSGDIVKKIADTCFDDGFPCEDGSGMAAAWFILACLGLYEYCPCRGDYLVTKPLFERADVRAEGIVLALPFDDGRKSVKYDEMLARSGKRTR